MLFALFFLCIYLLFSGLLCWHDIRTGLLPDRITCPLLWSGLVYHLCCAPELLSQAVWGAIAGYLAFALIYWGYRVVRGQEGLGYGDIKFLAALGAWHGGQALVYLVFIAALLACGYALVTVLRKPQLATLKNPLPFGPFLATAGLITGWQTFHTTVITLLL